MQEFFLSKAISAAETYRKAGHPIFVARRGDGFGERLRAMLNAMVASRLFPGTFRFSWPAARNYMDGGSGWYSIRPVEETFAPEFVETWHIEADELIGLDAVPVATLSKPLGAAYIVEQSVLDRQAPGTFGNWRNEMPGCFRDIAFAPDLEQARRAAAAVPGDFSETVALHLRAGDLVYGRFRKTGQFVGKACPWPIAHAICTDLAARGKSVLLFGQDEDLIDWLCHRHGAHSAAALSSACDFDAAQQALFEICLMARCETIVCGSSGFAVVAAWIGARQTINPYNFFDDAMTRSILEEATSTEPPDPRVSALQHAFACNAAITLRGDEALGDATGRAILDRALQADPENDFFRILRGVADIRAADGAAFETRLQARLVQGTKAVQSVSAVLRSIDSRGVPAIVFGLADLEAAARRGGALAAWCAAWLHAACKDAPRAAEFTALWDSGAVATGLDLPRPPTALGANLTFYGLPLSSDASAPDPEHLARFIECLKVSPSPAALTAIGPGRDGTYLLPDDLDGVVACFSPGVNNFKHFEDILAERHGIASHMCDASSDAGLLRTPLIPGLQTFERLWLDTTGADDAVSLDAWVARHRPEPDDLILQMDIEGAEWRNLLTVSDATLARFRILILELHGLGRIDRPGVLTEVVLPVLNRISAQFSCVHVHPNNVSPAVDIPGLDTPVPPLLEVTFLRRDRFDGRTLYPVELPHPLDIRFNVSSKPPLFASDAFRGRPPSEAERARMDQAETDWAQWKELGDLKERNARLEANLERTRADRAAAEATAAARKKRIRNLEKKVSQLEAQSRQAQARFSSLQESTSWRLTRPLRWLGRSLRGQTGKSRS